MRVAIVRYNASNTASVADAIRRLGIEPEITGTADLIASADRVIIPGVGEAASAMNFLRSQSLHRLIASLRQPVLGICLGMQILCKSSAEGNTQCLGVFPYSVELLQTSENEKLPHIGWNRITTANSKLFDGVKSGSFVYFAHSYAVPSFPDCPATCDYAGGFAAAVEHNNFMGVQFHPEKSGSAGRQILENFLAL